MKSTPSHVRSNLFVNIIKKKNILSQNKKYFYSIKDTISLTTQAFIDGDYCDAINGDKLETLNPATGEIISSFAHCKAADVNRAVAAGRRISHEGTWSRSAPDYRKEILLKLATLVEQHKKELAVLESIDAGKTVTDCLHEVGTEAPYFFQWYTELADKTFGKIAPTGDDAMALIGKEPAGVAGAILPWNSPSLMAVWKIAPALAAGCSIGVKPAEQTPLSTIRLGALLNAAGVTAGVVSILPGLGETNGQAIGMQNDIDTVSFTGSTEVGSMFMRYSGDSNLKSIGLEMGGKRTLIVLDDAPIDDDLIEHAAIAAFWNGGQNCSTNMR